MGGIRLTYADHEWNHNGVRFYLVSGWWHYRGRGDNRGQCPTLEDAVLTWMSNENARRMEASNAR